MKARGERERSRRPDFLRTFVLGGQSDGGRERTTHDRACQRTLGVGTDAGRQAGARRGRRLRRRTVRPGAAGADRAGLRRPPSNTVRGRRDPRTVPRADHPDRSLPPSPSGLVDRRRSGSLRAVGDDRPAGRADRGRHCAHRRLDARRVTGGRPRGPVLASGGRGVGSAHERELDHPGRPPRGRRVHEVSRRGGGTPRRGASGCRHRRPPRPAR